MVDKNILLSIRTFIAISVGLVISMVAISCSSSKELATIPPTPLPTLMAKPGYILQVGPLQLSQELYNRLKTSDFIFERGIYVGIWANKMKISDQNCNWEIVKRRVTLEVDGETISNDTLVGGPDGEPGCGIYQLSWSPDLEPGLHEIHFQFEADSGQIFEYKWLIDVEK